MSQPVRDRRDVLFTLWIFVILLYAYCDILGLYDARNLTQLLDGQINGVIMDDRMLIAASALMMVKIVMVPITRLARFAVARWANIGVALFATVVMIGTLMSPSSASYWMFGIAEIATTSAMVWLAWTWKG